VGFKSVFFPSAYKTKPWQLYFSPIPITPPVLFFFSSMAEVTDIYLIINGESVKNAAQI